MTLTLILIRLRVLKKVSKNCVRNTFLRSALFVYSDKRFLLKHEKKNSVFESGALIRIAALIPPSPNVIALYISLFFLNIYKLEELTCTCD